MNDVENYCLARSRWLRCRPDDARWLVRLAAAQLPAERATEEEPLRERITATLTTAVRRRYGNPVVVWLLLNIVVPIVVRLVIQWWLNRKE